MRIEGEKFIFRKVELHETELMNSIYALRFQVYCHECGFIKEEDYPEKLDIDKYDPQSVHFAAIGENGDIIGTMRMILPGPEKFPLENYCADVNIDHDALPELKYTEISRFVISKRLRRRRNDGMYYEAEFEDKEFTAEDGKMFMRRCRPMAFGLYREMYLESKRLGITHWYSLMEKSLWILLRLHAFEFTAVGEEVDVAGPVRPYIAKITQVEADVSRKFPQFYEWFTTDESQVEAANPSDPF